MNMLVLVWLIGCMFTYGTISDDGKAGITDIRRFLIALVFWPFCLGVCLKVMMSVFEVPKPKLMGEDGSEEEEGQDSAVSGGAENALVGRLRSHVDSLRRMADDTERSMRERNETDERRLGFYDGRVCCIREQALNIEDIIANYCPLCQRHSGEAQTKTSTESKNAEGEKS
jgi:hypothetical protein